MDAPRLGSCLRHGRGRADGCFVLRFQMGRGSERGAFQDTRFKRKSGFDGVDGGSNGNRHRQPRGGSAEHRHRLGQRRKRKLDRIRGIGGRVLVRRDSGRRRNGLLSLRESADEQLGRQRDDLRHVAPFARVACRAFSGRGGENRLSNHRRGGDNRRQPAYQLRGGNPIRIQVADNRAVGLRGGRVSASGGRRAVRRGKLGVDGNGVFRGAGAVGYHIHADSVVPHSPPSQPNDRRRKQVFRHFPETGRARSARRGQRRSPPAHAQHRRIGAETRKSEEGLRRCHESHIQSGVRSRERIRPRAAGRGGSRAQCACTL